jgi:hypothetical protein
MNVLKRMRPAFVFLLCFLCLCTSSCGGGGSGSATPTVASRPSSNSGGSGGGNSGASSSATARTSTSTLGISFVQGSLISMTVDSDGTQIVTLNNAPFQIFIPDSTFTDLYIRTTVANTGGVSPAGNVLPRSAGESSAGWYLVAVPENDSSVTGFPRTDMITSSDSKLVLNIAEIRDRLTGSKTTTTPLYLQFYRTNGTTSVGTYENLRLILK